MLIDNYLTQIDHHIKCRLTQIYNNMKFMLKSSKQHTTNLSTILYTKAESNSTIILRHITPLLNKNYRINLSFKRNLIRIQLKY